MTLTMILLTDYYELFKQKRHLHHVLEHVALCVSVAVPLGFTDDAVVFKEEDVAMVTSSGRPNAWSPLPHLEWSLRRKTQTQIFVFFCLFVFNFKICFGDFMPLSTGHEVLHAEIIWSRRKKGGGLV